MIADQSNNIESPGTLGSMSGVAIALMGLLIAAVAAAGVYLWQQKVIDTRDTQIALLSSEMTDTKKELAAAKTASTYVSKRGVTLLVFTPSRNAAVSSPLIVLGEVPGSWSFEAAFPVELQDATGKTVASAPAQLLGEWTTDKLVPFTATLPYSSTPTGNGTLILHKDNPSGLPQHADDVSIPVHF